MGNGVERFAEVQVSKCYAHVDRICYFAVEGDQVSLALVKAYCLFPISCCIRFLSSFQQIFLNPAPVEEKDQAICAVHYLYECWMFA